MRKGDLTKEARAFLDPKLQSLSGTLENICDYLHHADMLKALREGMYFRLHQLSGYDWLDNEEVDRGCDRMMETIGPDCDKNTRFEKELVLYQHTESNRKLTERLNDIFVRHDSEFLEPCVFEAHIDIVSSTCVWEIKCVSHLTIDHMIQVCVYAWIWRVLERPAKTFRLYNVKTHEMMILDATLEQLDDILFHLIRGRVDETKITTDQQFLQTNIARAEKRYALGSAKEQEEECVF